MNRPVEPTRRRAIRAILATFALLCATPALPAALDGDYHAVVDGVATVLTLRTDGDEVSGDYREGDLRFDVRGRFDGQRLDARLLDAALGLPLARITGGFGGTHLDLSIAASHPLTGASQTRQARFTRAGSAGETPSPSSPATAAGGGDLDPTIVGTWVHETQINSGGRDFAGFATVRTLELGADGQVRQWVQSAGGGSDWSYGSGGPELEVQGQWYADGGIVYVRLQGQAQFAAATRYRLVGAYLVTENVDGRINWRRR